MAEAGAVWVAFTATGAVLTYLTTMYAWPLQDAAVSNFDHTIGFDWLVWRNAVLTRPLLHGILQFGLCQPAAADRPRDRLFPQVGPGRAQWRIGPAGDADAAAHHAHFGVVAGARAIRHIRGERRHVPAGPAGVARRRSLAFRTCGHGRHCRDAILSHGAGGIVHLRVSRHRAGRIGVSRGSMRFMLLAIPPIGGHYLADMIVGGAIVVLIMPGIRWLRSLDAKVAMHWPGRSGPTRPQAAARCPECRIARSAVTSRSIIASVCSGVGVSRSRSSPRGTVG